jgi:uncharacterized protein YqjF (DUF2071 family)
VSVVDFLTTPARQSASLRKTDHRPWPLPSRGWLMAQTWENLLFAHWPVPAAAVREHVPMELSIDEYDGSAWVGVTPFRLSGLRLRAAPPAPFLSSFLELNARTYVTYEDKPGIWFFSLDASSRLAVESARRGYRLPYFTARMSALRWDGVIRYSSERTSRRARPAALSARYGPDGRVFDAAPGSLEHFLTERYCLYTTDGGRVFRGEIHHKPWPLQAASGEFERNTMPPPGIEIDAEPLLHFAGRQDVVIWSLDAVGATRLSRPEREKKEATR